MGTFQGCGESDSPARSRSPRTQRTLTPHNTGRKCRRPHKVVEPLCHIPGTHTMTRQMQFTTLPPRPMPGAGVRGVVLILRSRGCSLRFAPGCVNLALLFSLLQHMLQLLKITTPPCQIFHFIRCFCNNLIQLLSFYCNGIKIIIAPIKLII